MNILKINKKIGYLRNFVKIMVILKNILNLIELIKQFIKLLYFWISFFRSLDDL